MPTSRAPSPDSSSRSRAHRWRLVLVASALAAASAVVAGSVEVSAAQAQPIEEWVPAEGLRVVATVTECGPSGAAGEVVITVTADDPQRTWGYSVQGSALSIISPAADNAGNAEIPVGGPAGNYYVAVFHLPVDGQIPIVSTGFTIEPCAPGPPMSITTACTSNGGSATAEASLTELTPGFAYRHTFTEASGGVLGDPVTVTADASATRTVRSVPLTNDAEYRAELAWLPPPVAVPEWPTDFVPVESVVVTATEFAVTGCAASPTPPAATPAAPESTAASGLAESGVRGSDGVLFVAAMLSIAGALLLLARRTRHARD